MTTVKSFVRPDNTATIICPGCNAASKTSVADYLHKKHLIKIRCKCKTVFKVQLDFRSYYRKQTNLPGAYKVLTPSGAGGGDIHIHNISRNGIGFTVSGVHLLERGNILHLEFTLNDKHQTKLRKEAKVQLVDKNYIGCQFTDQDATEKALGFYLFP